MTKLNQNETLVLHAIANEIRASTGGQFGFSAAADEFRIPL